MNLYELIKKHSFQGFSLSVVRRIGIAILRCLRALFDERIIHCDLKPVSHKSRIQQFAIEQFLNSSII